MRHDRFGAGHRQRHVEAFIAIGVGVALDMDNGIGTGGEVERQFVQGRFGLRSDEGRAGLEEDGISGGKFGHRRSAGADVDRGTGLHFG